MAVVPAVRLDPPHKGGNEYILYQWSGLTENDVGEPIPTEGRTDVTVKAAGTWAGGQIAMQGELYDEDFLTLHTPQGDDLAITADNILTVQEQVKQIRPQGSMGAGMSVDVFIRLSGIGGR